MSALQTRPLPTLDDIRAERARRSLAEYIRQAWHVVEPATPYVHGWHVEAICAHLEAVSAGQIRNLVINMPPRHAKSLIVSVFWPTWEWIAHPERRWLFASYALSLSVRDSLKCRRLIESDWYTARWGDRFRLTSDQNAKLRFENDRTGYRIATSVDGAATGEGGDRVVVDDPHNVRDAESQAVRRSTLAWWDEAMSTRLNDQRTGAKVIVMQRVHEGDLSGHVLAQGGYEHLTLPAEYEPPLDGRKPVTSIGWSDPREHEGELLCPERVGPDELASLKRSLGPYGAAGQLQQRPAPRGGGMFRRAWWGRYRALPKLARVEQFVDSAFKEGVANDPSGCATWGADGVGNYYLIDYWEERLSYPDLMQALHDLHNKHKARAAVVPLTIEDKASGQSAIQTLMRPIPTMQGTILPRLPVLPFPLARTPGQPLLAAVERERELATLSKEARAESVTPLVAAGCVFLPEDAPWVEDFIARHEGFPNVTHDEPVDTTSMALIRLSAPLSRAYTPAVGGQRATLVVR